jgi:hypothetical protein
MRVKAVNGMQLGLTPTSALSRDTGMPWISATLGGTSFSRRQRGPRVPDTRRQRPEAGARAPQQLSLLDDRH